jgi:hypothetical protein
MNDTLENRLDVLETHTRAILREIGKARLDIEATARVESVPAVETMPEFLTVTEACAKYRISRTWFYRHVDEMVSAGVAIRQPGDTKSAMIRIDAARFDSWWRNQMGNRQP